jgi:predicted esterase
MTENDPHGHQPVLEYGANLEDANGVVILIHGRGSPAANIIRLAVPLAPDEDSEQKIAWLAPQSDNNTWYPYRFIVPVEQNEPWLGSALAKIDGIIDRATEAGIHPRQVALVGFSQGACLALEYTARASRSVGAVAALAGGLIGEPGAPRQPLADLTGTSVFIGVGDADDHIELGVAEESAAKMREAGATVDFRTYPGVGHTILDDEISAARDLVIGLPMIAPING